MHLVQSKIWLLDNNSDVMKRNINLNTTSSTNTAPFDTTWAMLKQKNVPKLDY